MPRIETYLAAQVATRPDAHAISDTIGADWTYADLERAVTALMAELAQRGVGPGDRVLILSENCAAKVAALFACWRLRATAVPINARHTAPEITRVINHAEPKVVLATSQVSADAADHAKRLESERISGHFGELHLVPTDFTCEDGDPDLGVLLYTTGTTGDPKGVMLTHDNLNFGGRASVHLRSMTSADLIHGVLPTTHVFGLSSIVIAAFMAGARLRTVPRFDPAQTCAALCDGVTLFSGVPQMHALIMAHARAEGLTTLGENSLRYVSSGAAPLDPIWKREAEAFYGVAIQNGYGMTETTAGVCLLYTSPSPRDS